MVDEPSRLVPVPCVQCGRPPVAAVGIEGGQYVNVCFEHYQQHEEMRLRKIQLYEQLADKANDAVMDSLGLPRKPRPQPIPVPRVNVQQVNIHGDNSGVVSIGTVGSITNSLTILNGQHAELAQALKELTEGILNSSELNNGEKQEAAELLREISEDAAKPKAQRRPRAVMMAIGAGLQKVLANAANLATVWSEISEKWQNLP